MTATDKSVITCDLEGRIETFGEGAANLFGYAPDEVIGKKRVSLFSPGLVVLEHVPRWLATAVRDGAFETDTVFVRKDGSEVPAHIKITPTMRKGEQIGYCGITTELPAEDLERVRPKISLGTRIFAALVITRAPFLTATIVPVLAAAALVARRGGPFPWIPFVLALVGAIALHLAANTYNDYFDWTSGTDVGNNDYFLPFSGGSRSIELGLITTRGLLRLANVFLAVGALCGLALLGTAGVGILAFGLVGAFAAFFYTAPPLRLAARKGLGELFVGLCFGPLMTAGTFFALNRSLDPSALLVGVPIGLLTTAILWINEFPDAPSDARAGKNHLVVVMGKRAARWGYAAVVLAAFAVVAVGVAIRSVPPAALLAFGAVPLAFIAIRVLFRHYDDRALIRANKATIQLHLVAGLLLAAGIRWAAPLQHLVSR